MELLSRILSYKEALYLAKKKDEITIRSSAAEYLTYVASVGNQQDSVEIRYENENIWLTQKMMATLYDVGINTINYHIKRCSRIASCRRFLESTNPLFKGPRGSRRLVPCYYHR